MSPANNLSFKVGDTVCVFTSSPHLNPIVGVVTEIAFANPYHGQISPWFSIQYEDGFLGQKTAPTTLTYFTDNCVAVKILKSG